MSDASSLIREHAQLAGARFRKVRRADASIEDSRPEGLRIDGVLVTELLRAHAER